MPGPATDRTSLEAHAFVGPDEEPWVFFLGESVPRIGEHVKLFGRHETWRVRDVCWFVSETAREATAARVYIEEVSE